MGGATFRFWAFTPLPSVFANIGKEPMKFNKTKVKGLWQRGERYYTRRREGSRTTWVALGLDYGQARKRLGQLQAGAPIVKRITVERALEEWLRLYVATRRTEKNQKLAAVRAKKYLLPFFGGFTLEKVTSDHVRSYRVFLDKQGLAPNTVTHFLSDLRAFLNWCTDTQRISRCPFPRRVMPRVQETVPKGLSDEEVAQLEALPEPLGFTFRFLLGTGLRWGEATRAQAADVKNGLLEVAKTKSGRVRRIPLSPEVLAEIRSRVGRLVPYSEKSTGSFNRMVRRATGIKSFHVHRTRHTYAMRWLAKDGSLAVLQEVLGHADLSTTARYAKVTQALVSREAERVHRALGEE